MQVRGTRLHWISDLLAPFRMSSGLGVVCGEERESDFFEVPLDYCKGGSEMTLRICPEL